MGLYDAFSKVVDKAVVHTSEALETISATTMSSIFRSVISTSSPNVIFTIYDSLQISGKRNAFQQLN